MWIVGRLLHEISLLDGFYSSTKYIYNLWDTCVLYDGKQWKMWICRHNLLSLFGKFLICELNNLRIDFLSGIRG